MKRPIFQGTVRSMNSKNLVPGENVAFALKPHYRGLIRPLAVLGIGTVAGAWAFTLTDSSIIRWVIAGTAVFIAVWQVALPLGKWLTTEYIFTDRRIIVRRGMLSKQGRDMPLEKINSVSFEVPFLGRSLNYGTLELQSASDHGDLVIRDVPDVEGIQRKVYELREKDNSRRSGLEWD